MNLNEMKLGELLPILNLLNGSKTESNLGERYLGKEVILRSYSAGNHFGILEAYDAKTATAVLKNSRRLWKWQTDQGISLSEVSLHGLIDSGSRICETVPEQLIAEVLEVLPTSLKASESIKKSPIYKP